MHLDPSHSDRTPGQRQLVRFFSDIAADLGKPISRNATVLDFGCGDGGAVDAWEETGRDTHGCDVVLDRPDERLRLIEKPYRFPFADATFDVAVSNMVLEHVQNHDEAFRELRRVLKPGGLSLHLFPARWTPIEPHLRVPLGTVLQAYWWVALWARLGIRNQFQSDAGWREVTAFNVEYLGTRTSYEPGKRILDAGRRWFEEAAFINSLAIKHGTRTKSVYPLARVLPLVSRLYGTVRTRLLLLARASDTTNTFSV